MADSEVDPATLENHLGREEVDDALHGKNGKAQRLSSTDDTNRLYVAVPATYQGERRRCASVSHLPSSQQLPMQHVTPPSLYVGWESSLLLPLLSLHIANQSPLKKFDQVRSDFVANASHELKTPVAGIRLLSEAIRDASDVGDEKASTCLLIALTMRQSVFSAS